MTDIDELLQTDAAQWNREQPSPPDLDHTLRAAAARPPRRAAIGRIAATAGAALAVAATIVAVVLVSHVVARMGRDQASSLPRPQRSIVVHGRTVPYAGVIPWSDAVMANPASTTITVAADGDATVTKKFLCGLPQERVYVTESSTTVTILVAGYAYSLGRGQACAGVGHSPQQQRVVLAAPLGRRALIDATDTKTHRVLDAATVPAPRVPAGFTADPVRWDEQTGLVTRAYRSPDALRGVEFRYGTRAAVETTVANPGTQLDPVTIDGSTATVRRYQDMYNDNVTVVWSSHGHRLALTVVGGPRDHLSVAAAVAIARSVR